MFALGNTRRTPSAIAKAAAGADNVPLNLSGARRTRTAPYDTKR